MFLLIGIWGSRQRKMHAAYQFFFYTVLGSIFLLTGMILLYKETNSLNLLMMQNLNFSFDLQIILWLLFFIGFCIKMPMVPFHMWLPEAHVEAPTTGSVLLAGVLLKVGSYGMFSFLFPMFPLATMYFSPVVYLFCMISIMYISCIAISQVDLKKIIAYSSIAHMNFIVIGLMSLNIQGVAGSIFLMISHGMVASALFICISIIYDSYHTSLMTYYGNLVSIMPMYSMFFFFFILANISFPWTSNFIGELLVLMGMVENNFFVAVMMVFSIVLSAIYSIWLMNSILFGQFKTKITKFSDLNKSEFFVLIILFFFMLLMGICPNIILSKIEYFCYCYLENF